MLGNEPGGLTRRRDTVYDSPLTQAVTLYREARSQRTRSRTVWAVKIDECPKCGQPGKLHAKVLQCRIKKGRKSKHHPYAQTEAGEIIWMGPYGEITHTKRCYVGKLPGSQIDRRTGKLTPEVR